MDADEELFEQGAEGTEIKRCSLYILQPTLATGGADAILWCAAWLARVVKWQTRQT